MKVSYVRTGVRSVYPLSSILFVHLPGAVLHWFSLTLGGYLILVLEASAELRESTRVIG